MVARTQLVALDNNANTGRSQVLVQSGEHAGEARYKLCFPKANKRWVVKPISEPKSYSFLTGLLTEVTKRVEQGGAVAQPVPVQLLTKHCLKASTSKGRCNSTTPFTI